MILYFIHWPCTVDVPREVQRVNRKVIKGYQRTLVAKNTFEYLTTVYTTTERRGRNYVGLLLAHQCCRTRWSNHVHSLKDRTTCVISLKSQKNWALYVCFFKHIGLAVQKLQDISLFLVLLTINVPFINDANDYRCWQKNAHDKFLQPGVTYSLLTAPFFLL